MLFLGTKLFRGLRKYFFSLELASADIQLKELESSNCISFHKVSFKGAKRIQSNSTTPFQAFC